MPRIVPLLRLALACICIAAHSTYASADTASRPPTSRVPWSTSSAPLLADLKAGRPLVTLVHVPLCANSQIHCGGQGAGDPGSLEKNLYWGRGYGVRRFFDETARSWRLIASSDSGGSVLQQVVYARDFPGKNFGLGSGTIRELLVLRAVHGEAIERAVDAFYDAAAHGAEVRFDEGGVTRAVRVHVVGYAGHNRLMDGYRLEEAAPSAGGGLPVFVIACKSAPYFSKALSSIAATPLVMTRDLVAPEGYTIEAVANALGENATRSELRERVVAAYARWQRIPERVAATIFSR
jgi:hypothetical protein